MAADCWLRIALKEGRALPSCFIHHLPMRTLLVIDDEQSVCYSFQRVFEGEQVRVLTARTAAEGLSRIREHNPDIIVLDLQLPDASGLEIFPQIQALDRKRPVIFITAHGTT